MSDFAHIVKHLDFVKARVASADDLNTSHILPDPLKYTKRTKTREITRIFTNLVLPVFNYDRTYTPAYSGRLLFQYNVTTPKDFYIENYAQQATSDINIVGFNPPIHPNIVQNGVLTVKWRHGRIVSRYIVQGIPIYYGAPQSIFFPFYSGQKIPKNCCFEYWFIALSRSADLPVIGLYDNLPLRLSYLDDPSTADELVKVINANPPLEIPAFGFNLPAQWPIQQPNIVWLDN